MKKPNSRPLPPSAKVNLIPREEAYIHVLRGLVSYHERMTMCRPVSPEPDKDCSDSCPLASRDFYLEALRFALLCMDEHISSNPSTLD